MLRAALRRDDSGGMTTDHIPTDHIPTAADFAPHLGKAFRVDGHPHALTFVSLNGRPRPDWPAGMRQPFSLLLRGEPAPVLAEGLHRVVIDGGPSLELYIIPVHTPARQYQDYQIVFN